MSRQESRGVKVQIKVIVTPVLEASFKSLGLVNGPCASVRTTVLVIVKESFMKKVFRTCGKWTFCRIRQQLLLFLLTSVLNRLD